MSSRLGGGRTPRTSHASPLPSAGRGASAWSEELARLHRVWAGMSPEDRELALAKAVKAATARTIVGSRYNECFDKTVSSSDILGKRLITSVSPEISQPLSQDEAMGHRLFVVGLVPRQFIYCECCHAYTGVRAQNLLRKCKGATYPSRAVRRLSEGVHPDDGTPLCTLPRRLTRLDVGLDVWTGDCLPCSDAYGESAGDDHVTMRCEDSSHRRYGTDDTPPHQSLLSRCSGTIAGVLT